MKFTLTVVLVCAFVAVTLAAAPNAHKQKRAANNNGPAARKNENHARAAEHHPTSKANTKGASKTQARSAPSSKSEGAIDIQTAVKSALDTFTPLAKEGSTLAVDAVKALLGDNKARNAPANLQKRAAKLATDGFSAVRDFTPTVAKLVETYTPKALEAASRTLEILGF